MIRGREFGWDDVERATPKTVVWTAENVRALQRRFCVKVNIPVVKDLPPTISPAVLRPVENLLAELPPRDGERAKRILTEVCSKFGVEYSRLVGECRVIRLTDARQEASYRLHSELGLSLPKIGKLLGYRDHSGAYYSVRAYARRNYLPR